MDGVDDPDARFAEPLLRVLAFLGQQAVIGPLLRDGMDKKLVRGLIARLAQRFAFNETRLAHGEKDRKSTTSELQSLMRISYAVFCLKKQRSRRRERTSTPITCIN